MNDINNLHINNLLWGEKKSNNDSRKLGVPGYFKRLHDQIVKHVEKKRAGEEWHILIKNIKSSGNTYIQYGSDGDSSFKPLPLKKCSEKTNIHFIDITEEIKKHKILIKNEMNSSNVFLILWKW